VRAFVRYRRRHPVVVRLVATLVATAVALVGTYYLSSTTNFNLTQALSIAIVLLGLSFLTGASGQVSLGNGAFMGVGAYAVVIWADHHPTTPIVAVLAVGTVAGAVVGLLVGLPATRLRGPYLAGLTIAVALAFLPVIDIFSSWTGGDTSLSVPNPIGPPGWLVSLFSSSTPSLRPTNMWLADVAIVVTAVAWLLMANLFDSRVGRAMRLVREHEVAAELAGVSLPRARVVAFVVSAAYAGLGGGLFALSTSSVVPGNFDSLALSITLLALIVIGGVGTLWGALVGGLIYAFQGNWVNWIEGPTGVSSTSNLGSNLKGIIYGGIVILVMLLAPLGIVGTLKRVLGGIVAKQLVRPRDDDAHELDGVPVATDR
jgi:branched-chain amino acid transport system permease protein